MGTFVCGLPNIFVFTLGHGMMAHAEIITLEKDSLLIGALHVSFESHMLVSSQLDSGLSSFTGVMWTSSLHRRMSGHVVQTHPSKA